MSHEQVDQLLAAFALGAATDEEAEAVRRHLPECDACTQALAGMTEVVAALPLAVEEPVPPAGMRERVLAEARRSPRVLASPARPARPLARPIPGVSWRSAFAAAAVVVAALGAWNVSLLGRLGSAGHQLAQLQGQTSHGTLVATHGAAAGTVSYLAQDRVALVSLHSLAAPPGGRTYELWVIDAAGHADPAGVFIPDADGTKLLVVGRALSPSDRLAVTVEPAGGSPQPTSAPFISGGI